MGGEGKGEKRREEERGRGNKKEVGGRGKVDKRGGGEENRRKELRYVGE